MRIILNMVSLSIVVLLLASPIFSQVSEVNEQENKIDVKSDQPHTLTVGPGQNFTTIQDAIDRANDGDTIIIKGGHYYEHISINKTLTLKGDAENTTIIDGGNSSNVIYITADECVIENLKIMNSGSEEIYREGSDIYAYIFYPAGMWVSSSFNQIINCSIERNCNGIYIYEGKNNVIRDCYFNNTFRHAIDGYHDKQTIVSACMFYSCSGISLSFDSEFFDNYCYNTNLHLQYAKAINNTIINDKKDNYYYSAISMNWGCTVKNNYCSGFWCGIYGYDIGDCVIEGNTCNNNSRSGIGFEMSGDTSIVRNTCNSNGEYGIEVLSGYNMKIKDNKCKNNGQKDIYVDFRSTNIDLENNTGSIDNGPKERNILCVSLCLSVILIAIIAVIVGRVLIKRSKKKEGVKRSQR